MSMTACQESSHTGVQKLRESGKRNLLRRWNIAALLLLCLDSTKVYNKICWFPAATLPKSREDTRI